MRQSNCTTDVAGKIFLQEINCPFYPSHNSQNIPAILHLNLGAAMVKTLKTLMQTPGQKRERSPLSTEHALFFFGQPSSIL